MLAWNMNSSGRRISQLRQRARMASKEKKGDHMRVFESDRIREGVRRGIVKC